MGKGNGGTRTNGTSTGGVVAAPKTERDDSGYRNSETSLRYSYNPDTVQFSVNDTGREYGLEKDITPSDLRSKADFSFSSVQRDGYTGKFNLGRGDYWFTENMSFAQSINRAIKEIKDGYRHNENIHDHYMLIESNNSPLWATVQATLKADNKVRIIVSRYKYENR